MLETLQKHKIKNSIEKIGFLEKTTKNADKRQIAENVTKRILVIIKFTNIFLRQSDFLIVFY